MATSHEAPCRPELYGVNIDPLNPAGAPAVADLQDAGARWVRLTFKVEGDDLDAAFARYDEALARLAEAGIGSLVVVNYETVSGKPAADADEATWDAYFDRFAAAAAAIAGRYGDQIGAFELWNEPDEPAPTKLYDPTLPAERFGVLLRRGYEAIRGAGSRAPVVTGGVDSGNEHYLADAAAATGGLWADGVGLHPYAQRAPDDYPSPDWGAGNLTDIVRRYRETTGLPVWITEIGTPDEEFQAEYLLQVHATVRAYFDPEQVPHLFWFDWSDGMVAPFGLHRADGSPKDSYESYVAETRWGSAGCE